MSQKVFLYVYVPNAIYNCGKLIEVNQDGLKYSSEKVEKGYCSLDCKQGVYKFRKNFVLEVPEIACMTQEEDLE